MGLDLAFYLPFYPYLGVVLKLFKSTLAFQNHSFAVYTLKCGS